MKEKTAEQFLQENSVLDNSDVMDGSWVPISIAMIAIEEVLNGKLKYEKPSWHKP